MAGELAWRVAAAPLAALLAERRVAVAAAAGTAVRIDERGHIAAVALHDPVLAILASDAVARCLEVRKSLHASQVRESRCTCCHLAGCVLDRGGIP
ncbi:MAG: hypothetical protein ACRDYA_14590, partial [Egibacteraceae bacterium]